MLKTRWLGRPVAFASLLGVLFASGCGKGASEANDEGRAVAVQFLDELRAGRFKPAWKNSSTEFKSLMGVENLRDYIKAHPALKAQAEYAESRTLDREGRTLAEYVFHATAQIRKKPIPATIKVFLASGNEGWKVERLAVE